MSYILSAFDEQRMAVEQMEERDYENGFRYSRDNSFREYEMKEMEGEQNGEKNNNAQAYA